MAIIPVKKHRPSTVPETGDTAERVSELHLCSSSFFSFFGGFSAGLFVCVCAPEEPLFSPEAAVVGGRRSSFCGLVLLGLTRAGCCPSPFVRTFGAAGEGCPSGRDGRRRASVRVHAGVSIRTVGRLERPKSIVGVWIRSRIAAIVRLGRAISAHGRVTSGAIRWLETSIAGRSPVRLILAGGIWPAELSAIRRRRRPVGRALVHKRLCVSERNRMGEGAIRVTTGRFASAAGGRARAAGAGPNALRGPGARRASITRG